MIGFQITRKKKRTYFKADTKDNIQSNITQCKARQRFLISHPLAINKKDCNLEKWNFKVNNLLICNNRYFVMKVFWWNRRFRHQFIQQFLLKIIL